MLVSLKQWYPISSHGHEEEPRRKKENEQPMVDDICPYFDLKKTSLVMLTLLGLRFTFNLNFNFDSGKFMRHFRS